MQALTTHYDTITYDGVHLLDEVALCSNNIGSYGILRQEIYID